MAEINTNYGNSFGYQDLIGDKGTGGLGDRISGGYTDLEEAMAQIRDKKGSGDPALLLDVQVKMNSLTQVLSMTTQLVSTLSKSCESINRNI